MIKNPKISKNKLVKALTSTTFHIGTSGYIYKWWFSKITDNVYHTASLNTGFYALKTTNKNALKIYSKTFTIIELNTTYYGLPSIDTVKNWYNTTSDKFRFIVKFSKYATTSKKLIDIETLFSEFWDRVKYLKEKLLGILIQLSPNFILSKKKSNIDNLTLSERVIKTGTFIKIITNIPIFIEFRHNTWFTEQGINIVKQSGMSMVFVVNELIMLKNITLTGNIYIRFHGNESTPYTGCYSLEFLSELVFYVKNMYIRDAFFIFNNTDSINHTEAILNNKFIPDAIKNALDLKILSKDIM